MPMTGNIGRVEVTTSVQRRRRWSAEEKARIVQETYVPGMSVSRVARQHGIAPNQVFTWRRPQPEAELVAEIKVLISPFSRPTATSASMRSSGVSAASKAARR